MRKSTFSLLIASCILGNMTLILPSQKVSAQITPEENQILEVSLLEITDNKLVTEKNIVILETELEQLDTNTPNSVESQEPEVENQSSRIPISSRIFPCPSMQQ